MDPERRAAVLAALAAGLLVVNLVVLASGVDDGPDVAVDDTIETPTEGTTDGGSPTAGEATRSDAPGDDASQAPAADGDGDDAGADDGGANSDADGDGDSADPDVLGTPASGTYAYASSGEWSLSGGGSQDRHELPSAATGVVRSGEDGWEVELVAGEEYTDVFTFEVGADGGLDWTAWVLERTFRSGGSTTPYTCSGDSAYYRPREAQRTASHSCETDGVTSTGSIEQVGSEDVTLGDGSVASADRLLYTYTVSGSNVSGEGRLDLWLDPATGMRLREVRSITTTTTDGGGNEFQYVEDLEFVLQSTTPDA